MVRVASPLGAHSSPRHACALHRVLFLRACGQRKGPPVQHAVTVQGHRLTLRKPAREGALEALLGVLTAACIGPEKFRCPSETGNGVTPP